MMKIMNSERKSSRSGYSQWKKKLRMTTAPANGARGKASSIGSSKATTYQFFDRAY